MSTIQVDTFEDLSAGETVDATYLVHGSLKAWCHYTDATFAAADSFNVTSTTDEGTGDFTTTWNNDFDSANYALSGMCQSAGNLSINGGNSIAGSCRLLAANTTTNGAFDFTDPSTMAVGDLA